MRRVRSSEEVRLRRAERALDGGGVQLRDGPQSAEGFGGVAVIQLRVEVTEGAGKEEGHGSGMGRFEAKTGDPGVVAVDCGGFLAVHDRMAGEVMQQSDEPPAGVGRENPDRWVGLLRMGRSPRRIQALVQIRIHRKAGVGLAVHRDAFARSRGDAPLRVRERGARLGRGGRRPNRQRLDVHLVRLSPSQHAAHGGRAVGVGDREKNLFRVDPGRASGLRPDSSVELSRQAAELHADDQRGPGAVAQQDRARMQGRDDFSGGSVPVRSVARQLHPEARGDVAASEADFHQRRAGVAGPRSRSCSRRSSMEASTLAMISSMRST